MDFVLHLFFKIFKPKSRTSLAAQQVVYTFGLRGLGVLISFLYVPLLLKYLAADKYGIWLALVSMVNWFTFLDIGLGLGLKNKLTEALANHDLPLAKKLVSTTYGVLFIVLIVFLVLFHSLNPLVNWQEILGVELISKEELYILTSIVFSGFILNLVLQTIGVIYQALQKAFVSSIALVFGQIVSLGCVYFLTRSGSSGNLILMGAVVSLTPALSYLILTVYSFSSDLKVIRPSRSHFELRYVREVANLGFRFLIIQISSSIIFASTSFFIIRLFDAEEVVRYNIAFKYFSIPIVFYGIFLTPIWASVTDAYIKGDYHWLKSTMKKLNILSLCFIFVIIIMIGVAEFVYALWLGQNISVPKHLTVLMGLFGIINVTFTPYSHFLNGFGKMKLSAMLSWVWIGLFISVMLLASKYIGDSSSVVLALCITAFLGSIMQLFQVKMLLRGVAYGIWNK